MTEQEQLRKSFNDLFEGSPWIDVTIEATLDEITPKEAATKPFPQFNSIWEVVNHMISYREIVLKRIGGEDIPSPEDNFFSYIRDRSENAWQQTRERFRATQKQWLSALKKMKRKDLAQQHAFSTYSNYELIQGILQHDAYHLGQIRLLRKFIQLNG